MSGIQWNRQYVLLGERTSPLRIIICADSEVRLNGYKSASQEPFYNLSGALFRGNFNMIKAFGGANLKAA